MTIAIPSASPHHYGPARVFDRAQLLGGVFSVLAVFGTLGVFGLAYGAVTGHSILDPRAIGAEPPPVREAEPEIVEAGFVQLGRAWDPRELPDRRISSNAQAPRAQDPDVVSPFQRLMADAGVPPPTRAMTSLLESSAAYDQEGSATFLYEQTGESWGAERARQGNMLLGQLDSLVRRGLEVPPNLPESEFASTVARVRVVVDSNWVVSSISVTAGSGNEDWDRAVRRRVEEIASASPRLQPTPGEESVLNQPITLNVKPRAARRGGRTTGAAGTTGASGGTGESAPRSTGSAFDRLLQ